MDKLTLFIPSGVSVDIKDNPNPVPTPTPTPTVTYPVQAVTLPADPPPATGWIMPPKVPVPSQFLKIGDPLVIHNNAGGATWNYANALSLVTWKTPGGDVKQKLSDLHIPPKSRVGVDISGTTSGVFLVVVKGMLNKPPGNNTYIGDIKIDGNQVPFWQIMPSQNGVMNVIAGGAGPWLPAPILINGKGKQLSLYNPTQWTLDFELYEVDPPKVTDWPIKQSGLGGTVTKDTDLRSNPAVLSYVGFTDWDSTFKEAGGQGNVSMPMAFGDDPSRQYGGPEFLKGPNNLPVMRFSCLAQGDTRWGRFGTGSQRLVATFMWIPKGISEMWVRYVIAAETDVHTSHGFTELGLKLPGLRNDWVSGRNEHRPPDYYNPGILGIGGTWCFPLDGVDDPQEANCAKFVTWSGDNGVPVLVEGRYYVMSQHLKFNTFAADGSPNRDGLFEAFLNGNKVYSVPHRVLKTPTDPAPYFHLNVYHGGMGIPIGTFHYRLGAAVISTTDPGVPPELVNTSLEF